MEKLCDLSLCTACMACLNICPTKAVFFQMDELGCLMPQIDEKKCIDCRLCLNTCPQLKSSEKHSVIKAYALYTKDISDRKLCSSGGVATTLGRWFLRAGGAVCGTAFESNGKPVMKLAENEQELEEFRGSKYVYCEPGRIYLQVKNILEHEKPVLFVGLPCQVDACKKIVGQSAMLMTIGLICHGTPPYAYLKNHLYKQVKESAPFFSFRGKYNYMLCAYNSNKKVIFKKRQAEDAYFSAYMNGVITRENCFQCQYAESKRVEDITIGDFWGLNSNALGGYKGRVSVALCNTEKGIDFFEKAKGNFFWEERDPQEAIAGNSQLKVPTQRSPERDIFCEAYRRTKSFSQAIKDTSIPLNNRKAWMKRVFFAAPRIIVKIINRTRTIINPLKWEN